MYVPSCMRHYTHTLLATKKKHMHMHMHLGHTSHFLLLLAWRQGLWDVGMTGIEVPRYREISHDAVCYHEVTSQTPLVSPGVLGIVSAREIAISNHSMVGALLIAQIVHTAAIGIEGMVGENTKVNGATLIDRLSRHKVCSLVRLNHQQAFTDAGKVEAIVLQAARVSCLTTRRALRRATDKPPMR